MQPDHTFANLQDELKKEIFHLHDVYSLMIQHTGEITAHPNFGKLIDLAGKMNEITQTDTGATAMFSLTFETAITILDTLTQQVDQRFGNYDMGTGLSDAMSAAKQLIVQQDSTSLITIEVIAQEWALGDAASTETEPIILSITIPTRNALAFWNNQRRWNVPEVGDNFADVLDGPYGRLSQLVMETLHEEQDIKVLSFSSIIVTEITKAS